MTWRVSHLKSDLTISIKSLVPSICFLLWFSAVLAAQENYAVFEENGKFGLKDEIGEVVIPANYENLGWSDNSNVPVGGAIGYRRNGSWGLISVKNKILTSPDYHDLVILENQYILASRIGKFSNSLLFGILNFDGTARVSFKYRSISPIDNQKFLVVEQKEGVLKTGIITDKDIVVIPIVYRDVHFEAGGNIIVRTFGDLLGLNTADGRKVLGPEFNKIIFPKPDVIQVEKHGLQGVYKFDGSKFIEINKKAISFDNDEPLIEEFPQWELRSTTNELISSISADSIIELDEDLYIVCRNGVQVIENINRDHVLSFQGQEVDLISEKFLITRGDEKYHIYKRNGDKFLKEAYDSIFLDDDYIFTKTFRKSNPWDIYSKYGNKVSKFGYQDVRKSSERYIPVKRSGYWGFIDFSGQNILKCKFDSVGDFSNKRVILKFYDTWGLANNYGDWVILPFEHSLRRVFPNTYLAQKERSLKIYDGEGNLLRRTTEILDFKDFGILVRGDSTKVGLMAKNGQMITSVAYDAIENIEGTDLVTIRIEDDLGIINKRGRLIIPMEEHYQEIVGVGQSYIGIKKDNKYGFIDFRGLLRIANRYDSIKLFADSLAAVKLNDKWGFVDMYEKLIIQPNYEQVGQFMDGVAIVGYQGKEGLISREGELLIDYKYDKIIRTDYGHFIVYENGKAGLVNRTGKLIAYPKYDYLKDIGNDQLIVNSNGRWGVLKNDGTYSIPALFQEIRYDKLNSRYLTKKF